MKSGGIFNLSIDIPKKENFQAIITAIKQGGMKIKYNTPLTSKEVDLLVQALNERKTNIEVLNLDSAFPSKLEDRTGDLIKIFDVAKDKVKTLMLRQNSLPKNFIAYCTNQFNTEKPQIKVEAHNSDIFNPSDYVTSSDDKNTLSSVIKKGL